MFKKYWISLIFLWFALVLGCFWFLYRISSDAQIAYQRLLSNNDPIKKEQLEEKARMTKQTRHHVSKQILYKKDGHRLQSRLFSEYSALNYSKESGELIEQFKDVTCVMQEKLMESSQQAVRKFKAKDAIYSYKSGQLEAGDVEVIDYLLPSHFWYRSFDAFQPLLEGRAQTIRLSLFKEPQLKAQGFQAIFRDWEEE